MPPQTPSRTRAPRTAPRSKPAPLPKSVLAGPFVRDLPLRDLLESDRERLTARVRGDQGRDELTDAFAELGVIGVDLARPLRGHDHQRVLRVDLREQFVDPRLDET